jgi:opacity protein-like surface antigen
MIRRGLTIAFIGAVGVCCASSAMADDYYPNGVYLKAGGGFDYFHVRSMELSPSQSSKLTSTSESAQGANYFAAAGYQFAVFPFALEIEALKHPTLDYNVSPIIQGSAGSGPLTSHLKSYSALVNTYYYFYFSDTDHGPYFIPFLTAGVGVSQNKVSLTATELTSATPAYSVNKATYGTTWQAGLGLRTKITNHIFVDLIARHMDLGKVQWGPWGASNTSIKSSNITSEEALLGLTIFFGDETPPPPSSLINDTSSSSSEKSSLISD